jgi:hypothetical protein
MSYQKTKRQASKTKQCGQKRKHVQGHTIEQLVNIKAPAILDCIRHYRRWDARKIDFSLCDSEIAQVLSVSDWLEEPGHRLIGECVLIKVLNIRAGASKQILDELEASGYKYFPHTLNLPDTELEAWNRIVDVVTNMAPDVKVLLETIADQISLLYEDREHEVLVTAEMLEEKAKTIGQKERTG